MAEIAVETTRVEQASTQQQSGVLPREMGFFGVFFFTLCSIGLTFTGINLFSTMAGAIPGVSLYGVVTVALVGNLLQAYLFAVIGSVAPRFAADYVVGSRVLNAPLAFAFSMVITVFMAWFAGLVITSITLMPLPELLRALSLVSPSDLLTRTIIWIASPSGMVTYGTIALITVFLPMLLSPRANQAVLRFSALVILVAFAIFFFQLVTSPVGQFEAAFNAAMGENQYLTHYNDARRLGMETITSPASMVVTGLMFGFLIFYGFANPVLAAGEVKEPRKNLWRGIVVALVAGWAILFAGVFLIQRVIPADWLAAEGFLSLLPEFKGEAISWAVLYAAILKPNPNLMIVLSAAWAFTFCNLAHTLLYGSSRVLLAWAKDRLIPEPIGFIHPSLKSPVIAVLVVCIVAEIGIVIFSLSGGVGLTEFNTIVFLALAQVFPVLAVTLLPYRKPDWFESAPAFARIKLGKVPLVTVAGVLSLLYIGFVLLTTLQMPIFAAATPVTLLAFGGLFLFGLAWYFVRRRLANPQGEDLTHFFKQLPEE